MKKLLFLLLLVSPLVMMPSVNGLLPDNLELSINSGELAGASLVNPHELQSTVDAWKAGMFLPGEFDDPLINEWELHLTINALNALQALLDYYNLILKSIESGFTPVNVPKERRDVFERQLNAYEQKSDQLTASIKFLKKCKWELEQMIASA